LVRLHDPNPPTENRSAHRPGTPSVECALDCLSETARGWFRVCFGVPTAAQRQAWPVVVSGESLLLCTPTGTGKTLAGMLPILDRILTERLTALRCLYLAPLKALVQDARVNLQTHVRQIEAGLPDSDFRMRFGMRTGDTSSRVRSHQLTDPPQVLLTTPESLAVLLTQPAAAEVFRTLHWVVVDELHALAVSKRGADLALSLERLERLTGAAGGLQRIGLSATCTPLTTAAQFLVGVGRPCHIARVEEPSDLDLCVEPLPYEAGPGFLNRLLHRLEAELAANRTTLIFTNTRSLAERVTWALRRRYPDRTDAVGVHHSALAPARRRIVERALKQGRLWVAVSSTSLELGIDIGSVDGVVFVHPPGSTVRLLQRLGRSGHRPGVPRRGLVLTASAGELLEATVTADCGRHGQIETLCVPPHPLDVLCQHLAGLAMTEPWVPDTALALVRRAYPYRDLETDDFRDCIDYLSGRRADGTAWLPARLRWDGGAFAIADDRTARLLRRNLGTILTEEPCAIRIPLTVQGDGEPPPRTSLVGELDEAYAERLQPGDRFMLDGRCLEYRGRDGRALLVDEVVGRPQVPRWRGTGPPMSDELASRLYLFRVQAAEALRDSPAALDRLLRGAYKLSESAATSLARYLGRQEAISEIPDFDTLLIECLSSQACVEYYFHTPLPCPANEAVVRVVADRMRRIAGVRPVAMAADLGFLLVLEGSGPIGPDFWRRMLAPEHFEEDFAAGIRESSLLRDRFAQVAQTGLMVLRHPQGYRPRVGGKAWASEQLFDQVRQYAPDFLLLRQAEQEAARAGCDLESATAFVRRVPRLNLRQRWLADPSPLADRLLASQSGPVADVTFPDEALERLRQELLGEWET
jgi:ATP-dependent Lhr-like helicase